MAKVAFVLDKDFEDSEFSEPYTAVRDAGHEAVVIGLQKGKEVKGKKGKETFVVERGPDGAKVDEFDALVIPGGYSPDHLRMNDQIVSFVRGMAESGKPVAAICHAGWLLAEADVVRGRTLTSWPSIRTDLKNAGATWVDQELVEDGNLITSRNPGDLPAFCDAIVKRLS
jgi:protease I